MKVKDLIIELSLCDPDYDVWVTHESDETGEVGEPQLVYQDNEYEDVIISFAGMGWLDKIIDNEHKNMN